MTQLSGVIKPQIKQIKQIFFHWVLAIEPIFRDLTDESRGRFLDILAAWGFAEEP